MSESRFGRVITFYSYKGGVGRTLAVVDTAVILARLGYRVLVVDWDLEAPGVDVYFHEWIGTKPRDGLIETIRQFTHLSVEEAATRVEPVPVPGTADRLGLVRAGRIDAKDGQGVQGLDWNERYRQGFGRWLEELRRRWQHDWDFVLIDSRTGIGDIGGVCTIQMPEILVVLFTPSDQSVGGVLRVATQAQRGQRALQLDRAPLRVVPVPTRIDNTEHQARNLWMQRIEKRFSHLIQEWTDAPSRTPHLLQTLAVPYVPFWSYGERLPAAHGDTAETTDKLSVEYAHEALALLLANELSGVGQLLDDRAALRANLDRAADSTRYDVFLSYSAADQDLAARLYQALVEQHVAVYWSGLLRPGDPVESTLADARARSRAFVTIIGPELGRNHQRELEHILQMHAQAPSVVSIIPILRTGVSWDAAPTVLSTFFGFEEGKASPSEIAGTIARTQKR